jgi:hypothetical protein
MGTPLLCGQQQASGMNDSKLQKLRDDIDVLAVQLEVLTKMLLELAKQLRQHDGRFIALSEMLEEKYQH